MDRMKHSRSSPTHRISVLASLAAGIFIIMAGPGCTGMTTHRFVDPEGVPLEGVLILSEQSPYFFTDWALSASVTDSEGRGRAISGGYHSYVTKPGYFSLKDGREVDFRLDDIVFGQVRAGLNSEVTLHPIVRAGYPPVSTTHLYLLHPDSGKPAVIEIPAVGVRVEFDFDDEVLRAVDPKQHLVASGRFYFDGPSNPRSLGEVQAKGSLFFYYGAGRWDSPIYKVGILDIGEGAKWVGNPGQEYAPCRTIQILVARLDSLDQRIQPAEIEDVHVGMSDHEKDGWSPDVILEPSVQRVTDCLNSNLKDLQQRPALFRWIEILRMRE